MSTDGVRNNRPTNSHLMSYLGNKVWSQCCRVHTVLRNLIDTKVANGCIQLLWRQHIHATSCTSDEQEIESRREGGGGEEDLIESRRKKKEDLSFVKRPGQYR
jgi:hypothetical protein